MQVFIVTFSVLNADKVDGDIKKAVIVAESDTRMRKILKERNEKLLNILFVEYVPLERGYFREIV